jgi:hypothetical protein
MSRRNAAFASSRLIIPDDPVQDAAPSLGARGLTNRDRTAQGGHPCASPAAPERRLWPSRGHRPLHRSARGVDYFMGDGLYLRWLLNRHFA